MGEVYRATDTKLGRDVAVKVVSQTFTYDPERAARFEREAQLLAALNHPHIAGIYGLEHADGSQFLVMELVEGETLAEKLTGGAVPADEAIRIAGQIADALSAAHDKGIIHRDLKPANIALTTDGQVKVLDFGLAKALGTDAASVAADNSPTLTLAATQAGVILGTAAYMAPEQAKGKSADKRSDLWAFGCVLYEMLTGRRTFDGDDASDTMAAVLRAEPDWSALPSGMPPAIRLLLRRCLEKDRRARVVDAGAALFVLRELSAPASPSVQPAAPARSSWRRTAAYAVAALVLMTGAVLATWLVLRPETPRITRFIASATPALSLSPLSRDLAISPDGARIVYRAGDTPLLYVRAMDRLEGAPLAGTENSLDPFFSPDGRWIAFWQGGFLKKISVQGGPPATIASGIGQLRGGTWGRDDTIVVANAGSTLFRVPAAGGGLVPLPLKDSGNARGHRWPQFLPDGRHLLVTHGFGDPYMIVVLDLETLEERELFAGSQARYASTGHLVYSVSGALQAVRFDAGSLEASADQMPVGERLLTKGSGAANFDVAGDGTLVYVPGGAVGGQQVVTSFDRKGQVTPLAGIPSGLYRDVRISPDGRRVAVATFDDVWTYDVARGTMSRLTTNPAQDRSPLWSRDGLRILFTSNRGSYPEVFSKAADGTGTEERLFARAKDGVDLRASGWSADGRRLLFTEVPVSINCAIGHATVDKLSEQAMLVQNDFCNDYAAVSPDGHWIAYDSQLSGRVEIYVERYPELGGRQQISTNGGRMPLWSANGRELYFSSLDARQMLAVPIQPGPPLTAGAAQKIFEGEFLPPQTGWRPYDIGPDGRFVIIRAGGDGTREASAANMVVVQHWVEELKRLVPAK
jgi:eukaryotic-like serine/threonine-protein kinase